MTNPLRLLTAAGQSVWLDYLHKRILEDGELKRLIEDDGLKGLTSNPSIFEKAIGGGDDYDARLKTLVETGDADVMTLYERLAIGDIQEAADQFRPTYDHLLGQDGYVSLEVSPYLAMDTNATIAEARRLWKAVNRPNLMIKVPGTRAGVPAIRQLIGEGININVTLLFAIDAYLDVAEAYIAGLEDLKSAGGNVAKTHSVASIFLSRIDVEIGKRIDDAGPSDAGTALRGKVAIASAKVAYQKYLALIATPRWQALAAAGASPQRLLWASTGTKDPTLSDVLYVNSIIGRDTISTVPPKTLEAFRDHGVVRETLIEDVDEARHVLAEVHRFGLDLKNVTDDLVSDGVHLFAKSFDELLAAVATKRAAIFGEKLNRQRLKSPPSLDAVHQDALRRAQAAGWNRRLWSHDSSLWTDADEASWLGWLDDGAGEAIDMNALLQFQAEVKAEGFTHSLLLGMGGSSLGPEVLAKTFPANHGFPELHVLDSTDPDEIARVSATIDLAHTLFIVSSKSGSTLEPNILCDYFFARAAEALGFQPGARFIVITDPGSPLEAVAKRDDFRHVFYGDPRTGGRYSVLTNFGMVPAAVIGLDVAVFFEHVRTMTRACGMDVPASANPGVVLGTLLGSAALSGRDKVTILPAEPIVALGAWLEQLLAESTGKHGKGLIPVNDEPLGVASAYGDDRLFVSFEMDMQPDSVLQQRLKELDEAGHPVVRIVLASAQMIGQEFFRWEVAVAVAGAVMKLNPFNQPDVEASKVKSHVLMDAYEKTGALESETPIVTGDGMALYADARNAEALAQLAETKTLESYLRAHFKRARVGDYVAILSYLDRSPAHLAAMRRLRAKVRDRTKLATVSGFGPRFLHSTGQIHKGGPNSGVFLQVTSGASREISIPGRKANFAVVETAQARGDFGVLAERGRRALHVDLGKDIEGGLKRLSTLVDRAIG